MFQQQQNQIMNLNIYKRHKSYFLHAKHKEKSTSKAYSNALMANRANQLLQEAKKIYQSQSHVEKAIENFEKFIELHPNHDQALYLCGVCEVQVERFSSAARKFQKVSQNYSLKQNALLLASIANNKMGHLSRSFELVNQCIKRSPHYQEALCFRGKLFLQRNNILRAQLDFKKVVGINSKSYLGWIGLGDCSKISYNYQRAIQLYQKSVSLLAGSSDSEKVNSNEIHLKIGVCYYLLQNYKQSFNILSKLSLVSDMKTSQLFYYLGLSELELNNREKGLNHLQFAIRLEGNPSIVDKAYKKLILLYLQDYQFYEAQTVSKLADAYSINPGLWRILSDSLMLVIRGQFKEGILGINRIYNAIKSQKHSIDDLKINDKEKRIDQCIFKANRISILCRRKYSVLRSEKQINSHKRPLYKPPNIQKKSTIFRLNRSIDKIQSTRMNANQYKSFPLKLGRFKTEHQQSEESPKQAPPFTEKEVQILMPIILRFKAYCQFLMGQYVPSSQTYEEYQLYIQDLLGKESDVKFNKTLVDVFIMAESKQLQQALVKCNEAIGLLSEANSLENPLPLLYKISILIRMAINGILNGQYHNEESYQILVLTLEMIDQKEVLKKHPMTHYFAAIIYILTEDHKKSKQCLETAQKLAETNNSTMFYMKGMVEYKLGNHLIAFRELTSSLMVKRSVRSYLARSIILFHLSQDKETLKGYDMEMLVKALDPIITLQDILKLKNVSILRECLVEKCLDDLQSYIDFCDDDQEITIWVTKVLFACGSYDEATAAIEKVTTESPEMDRISQCLNVYNGDFQKGGSVGLIIKSSLDGHFLTPFEEGQLLQQPHMKNNIENKSDYVQADYVKWLALLQLYIKEEYDLCIKFILKLISECQLQEEELMLRFNLAIIYFFTSQYQQAISITKSLSKFQHYPLKSFIDRIVEGGFSKDECLGDLTQLLHLRASKMLSSYLPYRCFSLLRGQEKVGVFVRICVPFPAFPPPKLDLQFDINFILGQLDLNKIPKSMEAPWIRRSGSQCIQFTDRMLETIGSLESNEEGESLFLPLKILSAKRHNLSPPFSLE